MLGRVGPVRGDDAVLLRAGAGGTRAGAGPPRGGPRGLESPPGTLAGPAGRRTAAPARAGRVRRRTDAGWPAHHRVTGPAARHGRRAARRAGTAGGGTARRPRTPPCPPWRRRPSAHGSSSARCSGRPESDPTRWRGAQRTGGIGIPITPAGSSCPRPPKLRPARGSRSPPDRRTRSRCCCRFRAACRRPGRAVRDGFLAGGPRRAGRCADQRSSSSTPRTLAPPPPTRAALEVGATAVAGPLMKEDVAALLAAQSLARADAGAQLGAAGLAAAVPVPVRARPGARGARGRRAASPRDGRVHGIALFPSNAWGERVHAAFTEEAADGRPRADLGPVLRSGRQGFLRAAARRARALRRRRRPGRQGCAGQARRRRRGARRAAVRVRGRVRRVDAGAAAAAAVPDGLRAAGVRHVGRGRAERARGAGPQRTHLPGDAVDPRRRAWAHRNSGTSCRRSGRRRSAAACASTPSASMPTACCAT